MAIIKPNNNTISAITALPAAIPTGKVLQVVQGSTAPQVTHSTSYADTGLTASITPSSSSNKVLIMIQQHCFTAGDGGGAIKLVRDSTSIYTPGDSYAFYFDGASIDARQYHSFNYLDSPSSTNSITYKTQARAYNSNAFRTQNGGLFTSFITLMEVSA
jgi:hypothetical protein